MLVADIAPVLAGAALPAHVSPDRQTAAIRAVIGACRRVLRWLALRGAPPGNRCLPDICPCLTWCGRRQGGGPTRLQPQAQDARPAISSAGVGKPAGRVPSPDDNSRRFKLAVPQRRCAPARGSASRTLRSI